MTYLPNKPQANDLISDSQVDLLNNFNALDVIYGGDHYPYSDVTSNSSKHKTVTTPIQNPATHPTPATNEAKFYAMQDTANLGVLQYSRRTNNAGVAQPPSPVTRIYTSVPPTTIASGSPTPTVLPILDLSGLTFATGMIYVTTIFSPAVFTGSQSSVWNFILDKSNVFSTNQVLKIYPTVGTLFLNLSFNVDVIEITNSGGLPIDFYCTIDLLRVNV